MGEVWVPLVTAWCDYQRASGAPETTVAVRRHHLLQAARELGRARREDLEPDLLGHTLRVVGKGSHVRLVPVTVELATLIEASPPGWLFPSPQGGHLTPHHLGKLVTAVLPEGMTMHTLRHRAATVAYATTRDLRAVQELLGHASPETTALYTQVPGSAIRAAMEGAA